MRLRVHDAALAAADVAAQISLSSVHSSHSKPPFLQPNSQLFVFGLRKYNAFAVLPWLLYGKSIKI